MASRKRRSTTKKAAVNRTTGFLIGGIVVVAVLISVLFASSSQSVSAVNLADMADMPAFVHSAPHQAQRAYQFAVANPQMIDHMPCYCGCNVMGHTSNLSCYVQEFRDDGTIVFDNHATGCGICVEITLDVMDMTLKGQSQVEIRQYIDRKYSERGPGTDTPYPQA